MPPQAVEVGVAVVIGAGVARLGLVVEHGLADDGAVGTPDPDVERYGAAVGHFTEPFGEMVAGGSVVGHPRQHDPGVQRQHDAERGAQIEGGQRRVHLGDDLGSGPDGRKGMTKPRAADRPGMPPHRFADDSHLGTVVGRVDEGILLGFVDEGEGRGHQRARRSQDFQEGVHHGFGAALNMTEGPHGRMDQDHVPGSQSDPVQTLANLFLRQSLLAGPLLWQHEPHHSSRFSVTPPGRNA